VSETNINSTARLLQVVFVATKTHLAFTKILKIS